MIEAKNITKTYQTGEISTPVLRGISLKIESGEYVSITGRSGAGKSTLLYQLGLLDYPTSGEIFIDGYDVIKLSSKKRSAFRLSQLGYVFQDYALLPELSALDNVLLPLYMLSIEKKEAVRMAMDVLEKVGLSGKEKNMPSQLSGGEQQRVSVARSVCNKPKILFADEPTANLDSSTAEKIMKLLKELHNQGQTIVLITHEDVYAKQSERIINLSDGIIEKDTKVG
jgi:putative ABC transport system ATP-binding protein